MKTQIFKIYADTGYSRSAPLPSYCVGVDGDNFARKIASNTTTTVAHVRDRVFTCVYAQGIEVLHVADSDAVVGRVPHHLVLDLLPAEQRLLDQHLRRHGQRLRGRNTRAW